MKSGILLGLALCGLSLQGVDSTPDDDIAREIRSQLEELHSLRAERLALLETSAAEREALRRSTAGLESDLAGARESLGARRQRRSELQAEITSAEALAGAARSFLDACLEPARERLAAWAASVESGIPTRRAERLDGLRGLLHELRGEQAADALARVWTPLDEDLRLASAIEVRNEAVPLGAAGTQRVHAFVVRMGLVFEAFVAEDGTRCGLSQGAGWTLDLEESRGRALRALIDAVRGRSAPGVLSVPVPGAR